MMNESEYLAAAIDRVIDAGYTVTKNEVAIALVFVLIVVGAALGALISRYLGDQDGK